MKNFFSNKLKGTLSLKFFCFFLLLLSLSGCQTGASLLKPGADAEEETADIYLYTQAFPQEADRFRFSIDEIFAVRDDGMEFPLSLRMTEFGGSDMKRQRLIASGRMPEGRYTGFSFRVRNASREIEEGEADLLVPEAPVMINFLFEVKKQKAYVFSLAFDYSHSVTGGVRFSPAFSVFLPKRPVLGLLGFVANRDSNNITVFDKNEMQVSGLISTGKGPSGIALDQGLRRAFVTLSDDDSVNVIDITAGEIINSIKLGPGDKPQEPALTPDGALLLTANTGSDTISLIDPSSLIELNRINVGNGPHSIAIDPAGRRAYIFNTLSSTISVIDIANRSVAATVATDPGPLRGRFNRAGDRLYIIHEWSAYVTVLDPFSLTVLDRFRVGMGANALKIDTRSDLLYISRKDDTQVEVYNPFSKLPIDRINTDGSVSYITIDGKENSLYLVAPDTQTVMIVDIVSLKTVSIMDVGKNPCWVTMMGE
jgi:YVTN family beta-propeller protein